MPISLGKAAKSLRGELNLSMRQAALELGISHVHLCNIENEKASPSPEMLEKFHDAWGIDLYMYALAFFPDDRKRPKGVESPMNALKAVWKRHIEKLILERSKE